MKTYTAQFRWTTEKTRIHSFKICNLYINGLKTSSCYGGGFDVEGHILAEYLQDNFQNRLFSIKNDWKGILVDRGKIRLDGGGYGKTAMIKIMQAIGLDLICKNDRQNLYLITDKRR